MTAVDAAGKNLVFIVGSPRSGTTWLARLMGAHVDVAAMQETELISRYCQSWYAAWRDQLPDGAERWRRNRHRGLPAVLTTEEFDGHVVAFARDVYAKVLGLKPTARVLVDKTPENALHVDLIRRLFPDALVLHLVRDGRDVAESMLAASRGWGRDWAPGRVRLAAQTWRSCVETATTAAHSGPYLQIRYEDLVTDGPLVLAECLRLVGVDATPEEVADIVDRFDIRRGEAATEEDSLVWSGEVVKRLGAAPSEPPGFFGPQRFGAWQERWTAWERMTFASVAGGLLRELGYADGDEWVDAPSAFQKVSALMNRTSTAAAALGWRLHVWLGRRGLYVHLARINPYE